MQALKVVSNSPRRINGDVSDLFFNLDFDGCKVTDQHGQFVEFDAGKLLAEAAWFSESLGRLGVDAGTPDDIVADFIARV